MMDPQRRLVSVPYSLRRGAHKADEAVQIGEGVRLLDLVRARLGLETLSGVEVLDVGCGTKLAQAIMNQGIAVGRYVGIDVYREMIEFLRENVDDPRLEFHHVDFQNAMYNPGGIRMKPDSTLPVGDRTFDVIVLFSVFTHLAPDDFRAMLSILRRYVRNTGHLLFTLFIDPRQTIPFRDAIPEKPLQWAYYSEAYARELVTAAGWEPLSLYPRGQDTQHCFVCRPA